MSSATYELLLREALVDLSEIQEVDAKSVGRKIGAKKAEDHQYFLQHWSALYLRYVQIARKLCAVHDQILQPQKRQDIRVALDATLGRMLEMKNQIIRYCGDYVNLDEALVDLKLTPDALEIPIPSYFADERKDEVAARERFIRSLCSLHQIDPKEYAITSGGVGLDSPDGSTPMPLERAIEILQCNERGRQGRQKAKFLKSIHLQEQYQHRDFEYANQAQDQESAATSIQRIVRGFLARKRVEQMKREELEFLGMEMSDKVSSNVQRQRLLETIKNRKNKRDGNAAELAQSAKEMRAQIKLQEGGRIMEEMLDEVLLHMTNLRLLAAEDVLPEFPSEEEGGSLALLGMLPGQLTPEEEAKKKAEADAAAAAASKKGQKEPKKTEKELEEEALPSIGPSLFWSRFDVVRKKYTETWQNNFQKSYLALKDFDQRFDSELLRSEIMDGPGGVITELRKCVDQLVMVEVTNLRERMERERGVKKRKPKPKKAPKKKNVKDPTEGKKMEEHMSRLVAYRALQLASPVALADYIGAPNMLGSVMDEYERAQGAEQDAVKQKWQQLLNNWNEYVEQSLRMTKDQFEALFKSYCDQASWSFEPSMQQVRQSIAEYCILPLGSQIIHDLAPHPNTVLLYGPAKSGKTMLTHAVCHEARANLFSLSPNVVNQEGISSLPKLVQAVFRVARALAPSVIYIDEVEKVFASGKGRKKKKKNEGGAPGKSGKIKKDLINQMKEIEPTDRVLVMGNSRTPWEAEFKDVAAFFKSFIYCVHPDYSSRLLLWQKRCASRGAVLRDDEYEVLAYMSNKYTSGTIIQIIDETLTERRIKRVKSHPVTADEFLPAMSKARPIFKEEYEATKEFTARLPLDCRRARFPADFVQDDSNDADGKGKKKKAPAKKKAA